jgi:hypothetical protein
MVTRRRGGMGIVAEMAGVMGVVCRIVEVRSVHC